MSQPSSYPFTSSYCKGLLRHSIISKGAVDFPSDIPSSNKPFKPLGVAIKEFFDGAVYGQSCSVELYNKFSSNLNEQLKAVQLNSFSLNDYQTVMEWRLRDTDQDDILPGNTEKQGFWGSNRQLLYGQVASDILTHYSQHKNLHPLVGVLCNTSGGIIGPGTHNDWIEREAKKFVEQAVLNYHAVCHDGAGWSKRVLNVGPGYTYVPGLSVATAARRGGLFLVRVLWPPRWLHSWNPRKDPWAGQIQGIKMWGQLLQSPVNEGFFRVD